MNPNCWLAARGYMENGEPMTGCEGRMIRAHLIPRQLLKRNGIPDDDRTWVPACGGITGVGGHHHAFDSSRKLRVHFSDLPLQIFDFAKDHGLLWYLSRTYPS